MMFVGAAAGIHPALQRVKLGLDLSHTSHQSVGLYVLSVSCYVSAPVDLVP